VGVVGSFASLQDDSKDWPISTAVHQFVDRGNWFVDGGRWFVEEGRWFVDGGTWFVEEGRWFVDGGTWFVDEGRWFVDGGRWFIDRGMWFVDDGRLFVDRGVPHALEGTPRSQAGAWSGVYGTSSVDRRAAQANPCALLRHERARHDHPCASQRVRWRRLVMAGANQALADAHHGRRCAFMVTWSAFVAQWLVRAAL
jgi:predicted transcriptional regulator